ncbi:MAG: hypothetical protein KDB88_14580, partial [Flavobacteriales bacterium]|nr:hypothetical protein [Flavobacteriales bacterium]
MNTAKNISQFALVTLIAAALTSCGKEELVAPEAQYTDMEARMEVGAPVVKQKQMNALGHE